MRGLSRQQSAATLALIAVAVASMSMAWSQAPTAVTATTAAATAASRPAVIAAPAPSGGTVWSALTPGQRSALAPLEKDWSGINSSRKRKWLEVAARFPSMQPQEQRRIQDRMAEWARLSPAERGRARLSFQEAKQLSPRERQAQWQAYQTLPDNVRNALVASAAGSAPQPGKPPASRSTAVSASGVAQALGAKAAVPAGKSAAGTVQAVAPTLVQAGPGATTTSIGKSATPPVHHSPGQPKIAAKPGQVDRTTLLPRKPEAAAAGAASASTPKPQS